MRALFYRSLRTIEQALSARREYMTKEGQIIYGGPDHYARLAATKHFRGSLSAGRPAPKQPEKQQRKRLTLPELEELRDRMQKQRKQAFNVRTNRTLFSSRLEYTAFAHSVVRTSWLPVRKHTVPSSVSTERSSPAASNNFLQRCRMQAIQLACP